MGSGLIRELLGIQDPAKAAAMQSHAMDMQIKQAQLQKLLAGDKGDMLGDQIKQMKLQEMTAKQNAMNTLMGGGGGMPQGGALAGYAPMQTGGEHLNEDGSIVSDPMQEQIWQENNGGFSTGGIPVDQLPPVTPLQGYAAPAQSGGGNYSPEQLQALMTLDPKAGLAAMASQEKKAKGKNDFSTVVDDFRGLYNQLQAEGGAVTEKGGVKNALANFANLAIGSDNPASNFVGKITSPAEQSLRNEIRARVGGLLPAMMSAQGGTSRMFDTEAERKGYLAQLGDPSTSIEANMRLLNALERDMGNNRPPPAAAPKLTPEQAARILEMRRAKQ